MKKILCALFALLLWVQLAPAALADGEQAAMITVSEDTQCVGETVALEVNIANNPGYASITIEVLYDAVSLKLTEVEAVKMPSMFAPNVEANRIAAAGLTNIKSNGTMFILHFEVLAPGEHTVSLNIVSFADKDAKELSSSVTAGQIGAAEHAYQTVTNAATCTKDGATVHTCTACGDTYESDRQPALGHIFDDSEDVICNLCGVDTSKGDPATAPNGAQQENGGLTLWLIVLIAVLTAAVLALSAIVIVLLKRKKSH